MPSARLILAAQTNGRNSRGPKTPEGKRKSSANSLKHGLYRANPETDHQYSADFHRIHSALIAEFQPENPGEQSLIAEMAHSHAVTRWVWRTERDHLEKEMERHPDPDPESSLLSRMYRATDRLCRKSRVLDLLHNIENRAGRRREDAEHRLGENRRLTAQITKTMERTLFTARPVTENSGNEPNSPDANNSPSTKIEERTDFPRTIKSRNEPDSPPQPSSYIQTRGTSPQMLTRLPAPLALAAISSLYLAAQTPSAPGPVGIDPGAIDRAANPCNDFYQYACGTWVRNNPIPGDQSSWGRFQELAQTNRDILHKILEKDAVETPNRTPVEQKIGDYYASCMEEKAVDAKGATPVRADLDRIANLTGKDALAQLVAHLHTEGIGAFFRLGSTQDPNDASKTIGSLGQGGLSLPDRDFYLKTDPKSLDTRAKYQEHVQKMFELLGHDSAQAAAEAKTVLNIETALAKASADRVSLRDPQKRYNHKTLGDLDGIAPSFDWSAYLKALSLSLRDLNVGQPDFVKGFGSEIANASLADLKTYLDWHVLDHAAPLLSAPFVTENFDFNSKTMQGVKEQQVRWKRCVVLVDRDLGEALGQEYVRTAFGAGAKERTLKMVTEIESEMAKDIQSISWMSDATRTQALAKLHLVANKIGYPDKWRDYSGVRIVRGDLVGDEERAAGFAFRRQLDKIGKPVDKLDWSMSPPTVNAYYNPPENNINFPAGILQPPFYFRNGDEAANYGAIGAVVGHELTHGFDDSGRQYDGEGNLRDWWIAADANSFKERADCIANEYSNFVASGDVKENGRLTLGENGADNGGLRLAYMALMDSLANRTLPNSQLDGYTPQQRFFLAWGQIWCQNITDQAARLQALTNPHSLGRYRVNGVVQNMPEFEKAFGCHEGQPMVSPNACRVW